MSGQIELERREDGVAFLWINNPSHRNALNNGLIEVLTDHYQTLGSDPTCRAIVLRGRGGMFCAGRELNDLVAVQQGPVDGILGVYETLKQLHEAVVFCPVPTIVAIEKYALGLGMTITSWSDIAISADSAKMGYPETGHGFPPSPAIMSLFQSVGRKKAMELLFTGRRVAGPEAENIGLITLSVPAINLDEQLDILLSGITRSSPEAIKRTKEFIWHSDETPHRAAITSSVHSVSLGLASEDGKEGVASFFEKRSPRWVPKSGG